MNNVVSNQPIRISDYFNLGKEQVELDFVDVPVNTDLPLFCDPYAFVVERDPWFEKCNALVYHFFSALMSHVHNQREADALRMLNHVGEANDAHLGFSRGRPGSGIGEEKAKKLYERLKLSRAVKTGKLYDLSDCDLFIPGIGPDNISDMTINIIRLELLEYTRTQCLQLGIPLTSVPGGFRWNPDHERWDNGYAYLPIVNGTRVLFIPKAAVRYRLALNHQQYYRHFVLDYLQAENIRIGSSLVHLFKNGKPYVTKKSLEEKHPFSKDFLFEFSDDNPHVLDQYKYFARSNCLILSDENIEKKQPQPKTVDLDEVINKLRQIPSGNEFAHKYHIEILGALTAIFHTQLRNFTVEQEINDGRKRIDIVANNMRSEGFFGDLYSLHKILCPYILIECKNYSKDLGNPEYDQLAMRFSNHRGEFGLLICRNITDKDKMLKTCRDAMLAGRGYIVALDDNDIVNMLEFRKTQSYSKISDYMRIKLHELIF